MFPVILIPSNIKFFGICTVIGVGPSNLYKGCIIHIGHRFELKANVYFIYFLVKFILLTCLSLDVSHYNISKHIGNPPHMFYFPSGRWI